MNDAVTGGGFVRIVSPTTTRATGLLPGVRILTLEGPIPVEYLSEGDRIVTRGGGAQLLRGVKIEIRDNLRPCTILPGVLGHDSPEDGLRVAPDQPILLRGWRALALYGGIAALVPAKRLVDGRHVVQATSPGSMRCFSLLFGAPHVIYAEDAEVAMLETIDAIR